MMQWHLPTTLLFFVVLIWNTCQLLDQYWRDWVISDHFYSKHDTGENLSSSLEYLDDQQLRAPMSAPGRNMNMHQSKPVDNHESFNRPEDRPTGLCLDPLILHQTANDRRDLVSQGE